MPNRTFKDPDGVQWEAWDVIPGRHAHDPEDARRHLPEEMADGWLCFESPEGKRRLKPIPVQWDERTDAELWMYCRVAEPVRRPTPSMG